jgi:outer membrane protein, heavy metal efflux system
MSIFLSFIIIFSAAGASPALARGNQLVDASVSFQAPALDSTSTLDDYILFALASNPALESSFYRWQAALQQAPQAGALPEPRLGYGYFLRQVETRAGPQVQRFGISQAFPWFGKLALARGKAEHTAQARARNFESDRLELIERISATYADFWLLGRRIEITGASMDLLAQAEEIARNRYSTGATGFSQLIKLQLELARLEDELASLAELAGAQAASFNAMLGRNPGSGLPFPSALDTTFTELPGHEPEALMLAANPLLEGIRELQLAATKEISLAGKQRWPDITFGLDYIQTDKRDMAGLAANGKDPVIASVSIGIPLWSGRYAAGEKQAVASLAAYRASEAELANTLGARLQQALFEQSDSRRKAALYGGTLLPGAEQALRASLTALAAGNSDVLDVLDSQRTLLSFHLEHERAMARLVKTNARIAALTGQNVQLEPTKDANSSGGY